MDTNFVINIQIHSVFRIIGDMIVVIETVRKRALFSESPKANLEKLIAYSAVFTS